MIAEVYDALKEAGASEEKSRAAAEAVASYENRFTNLEKAYDNRFASIERKLTLLTWQINVVLAGIAALILKTFFT